MNGTNGIMKTLLVVPLGAGVAYSMDCPAYMTLRHALNQAKKRVKFMHRNPALKIYVGHTPVSSEEFRKLDRPLGADVIVQEIEGQSQARKMRAWRLPKG